MGHKLEKIEVKDLMNIENLDQYVAINAIFGQNQEQFCGNIIRQSYILNIGEVIKIDTNGNIEKIELKAIKEAYLVKYTE